MEKRLYKAPWAEASIPEMEEFICLSGDAGVQDYNWNNEEEE